MDSDSDDDDLLAPNFLAKPVLTVNDVLTPKKGSKPVCDKALSPLTPLSKVKAQKPRNAKAKISLSALLQEKQSIDIAQKKIEDITELEQKYCEKDFFDQLEEEQFDASQLSQSQDLDCSQDPHETLSQHLNEDEKKKLNKVTELLLHDFPDAFPGAKMFCQPVKTESIEDCVKVLTAFVMDVESVSDEELHSEDLKDLLHEVLLNCLPVDNVPVSVQKVLWKMLYMMNDYKVSRSSLALLKTIFFRKESGGSCWRPSVSDFTEALYYLGANQLMIPDELSYIATITQDLNKSVDAEEFNDVGAVRKSFVCRLHNLSAVVILLTLCVQRSANMYTPEERKCFLFITFRLTIEKIVQTLLLELRVFIGALLDAFTEDHWSEQRKEICDLVTSSSTHHHNFLHMVEAIPQTTRGIQLQQKLAYQLSCDLVTKHVVVHDIDRNVFPIHPRHLYDLICCIEISNDNDYYELHTVFSLFALAMSPDDITISQKSAVKDLCNKLKMIHGEIKEALGFFINRTKVKDIVLRLISLYTFAEQNLKTQCHLDSYFGRAKDNTNDFMNTLSINQNSEEFDDDSEVVSAELNSKQLLSDTSGTLPSYDQVCPNSKVVDELNREATNVEEYSMKD